MNKELKLKIKLLEEEKKELLNTIKELKNQNEILEKEKVDAQIEFNKFLLKIYEQQLERPQSVIVQTDNINNCEDYDPKFIKMLLDDLEADEIGEFINIKND